MTTGASTGFYKSQNEEKLMFSKGKIGLCFELLKDSLKFLSGEFCKDRICISVARLIPKGHISRDSEKSSGN